MRRSCQSAFGAQAPSGATEICLRWQNCSWLSWLVSHCRKSRMISSGLRLFCLIMVFEFKVTFSSHSFRTSFNGGGQRMFAGLFASAKKRQPAFSGSLLILMQAAASFMQLRRVRVRTQRESCQRVPFSHQTRGQRRIGQVFQRLLGLQACGRRPLV